MTRRQECILITLKSISDRYHKKYCFPPVKVILAKLEEFHGEVCCRRTLYRDMKFLEENGFIGRQCRHFRKKNGVLKLRSTLYWLRRNAYRLFESLASWLRKHGRSLAVTKMSLDKPPKSKYFCFEGLVDSVLDPLSLPKERLRPSEAT